MQEVDKLTGFLTHKVFMDRLDEEVQRVKRYKGELSFLMAQINYDFFEKSYDIESNLSYTVLRQLGSIFRKVLRDVDLAARYEGSIVGIMLPATGAEGAKLAAERLRKSVEEHEFKGDDNKPVFHVALSVGSSTFAKHAKSTGELVAAAQKGLRLAIEKGGNCIQVSPVTLDETPAS